MNENLLIKTLQDLEDRNELFPGYKLNMSDSAPSLLGKGADSYVYEMKKEGEDKAGYALKVIIGGDAESFEERVRLQKLFMKYEKFVVYIYGHKQITLPAGICGEEVSLQMLLMERAMPVITLGLNGNPMLTREDFYTAEMIARMASDISMGLMYIHYDNVMHRDIKLENIYWYEEEEYTGGAGGYKTETHFMLGDFGSAAKMDENGEADTIVYTNGYGAPEIKLGLTDRYSFGADQYSFGMMIYLLLNGLCFPGTDGYHINAALQYNREFEFPDPAGKNIKGNIRSVAGILRKACSFNPEKRYPTIEQLRDELTWAFKEYFDSLSVPGEKAEKTDFSYGHEDTVTETYIDPEEIKKPPKKKKNFRLRRAWILKNKYLEILPQMHSYKAVQKAKYYKYREEQSVFIVPVTILTFLSMIGMISGYSASDKAVVITMAVLISLGAILQWLKKYNILAGFLLICAAVFLMIRTGVILPLVFVILGALFNSGDLSAGFGFGTLICVLMSVNEKSGFWVFLSETPARWVVTILLGITILIYLFRALAYGGRKDDPERES